MCYEYLTVIAIIFHLFPVLEENARSVYDYSGNLLKYYHVSLQPADWYQWFDRTQGERGTWVQVHIYNK